MPIRTTAVCLNPTCGAVWIARLVGIPEPPPGQPVILHNMTTEPCPQCGLRQSAIADGVYTSAGAWLTAEGLHLVLNALRRLQERAEQGATVEELHKKITKNPVLAPLQSRAPKDKSALVEWLTLLATSLGVLLSECRKEPSQIVKIVVDDPVAQSITAAAARAPRPRSKHKKRHGRRQGGSQKGRK